MTLTAAIRLSKATMRKMKQNLFWAAIYNVIAIPIAGGILYPLGILLNPAIGALAMSASSITVATNAVLLKGVERHLLRGASNGLVLLLRLAAGRTAASRLHVVVARWCAVL